MPTLMTKLVDLYTVLQCLGEAAVYMNAAPARLNH